MSSSLKGHPGRVRAQSRDVAVAPPGRPCPECLDILAASRQATAAASRRPRHRRPGLLRRLWLGFQPRGASIGKDVAR
ncbi:MAG: hypothetical protein ACRDRW_15450 [Pseudonocardiaceae bacterium]